MILMLGMKGSFGNGAGASAGCYRWLRLRWDALYGLGRFSGAFG